MTSRPKSPGPAMATTASAPAPIIRTPERLILSLHTSAMTLPPLPDESSRAARLRAAAAAGRAWLAAGWRRATGRPGAASPAGVTLLENGGRNDGPPDLDELWRDFNRKLSGLFGRGGAKRGGGGDSGGGPN